MVESIKSFESHDAKSGEDVPSIVNSGIEVEGVREKVEKKLRQMRVPYIVNINQISP